MAAVPGPEPVFNPAVRADGLEGEVVGQVPLYGAAYAPDIQFRGRAHPDAEAVIRLQFRSGTDMAAPSAVGAYGPLIVEAVGVVEPVGVGADAPAAGVGSVQALRVPGQKIIEGGKPPVRIGGVFNSGDQHIGSGLFAGGGVIGRQVHGDVVRRRPAQSDAPRPLIVVAQIGPLRVQVFHIAVAVPGGEGKTARQGVVERHIDIAVRVDPVVTAGGDFGPAKESVGLRLAGDHRDGAAYGVASEQGALGAAEYLHALHIHRVHDLADGAGDVNPVEINANPRVDWQGPVSAAHAADHDDGGGVARGNGGGEVKDHIGGEFPQVGKVHHAPRLDVFTRKRGDGDRRVLQAFLAFARGDDDFLQRAGLS